MPCPGHPCTSTKRGAAAAARRGAAATLPCPKPYPATRRPRQAKFPEILGLEMKELDLHPAGSRKGNIKGARPPARLPAPPPVPAPSV